MGRAQAFPLHSEVPALTSALGTYCLSWSGCLQAGSDPDQKRGSSENPLLGGAEGV